MSSKCSACCCFTFVWQFKIVHFKQSCDQEVIWLVHKVCIPTHNLCVGNMAYPRRALRLGSTLFSDSAILSRLQWVSSSSLWRRRHIFSLLETVGWDRYSCNKDQTFVVFFSTECNKHPFKNARLTGAVKLSTFLPCWPAACAAPRCAIPDCGSARLFYQRLGNASQLLPAARPDRRAEPVLH